MDGASNSSDLNLTARMVSSGTITVKLRYKGTNPTPPPFVWLKLVAVASYVGNYESATGTASNGIGDPTVTWSFGGDSQGFEYYRCPVSFTGGSWIATKQITLYAEAVCTGPYSWAKSDCGSICVDPDGILHDARKFVFTNTAGAIVDSGPTFGSELGSPFPIQGWDDSGATPVSYPVHYVKEMPLNVTLEHKVKVAWAEPTPPVNYDVSGIMSDVGVFFSWPSQTGVALESFVSKSFVSTGSLLPKIYKFMYQPDCSGAAEAPFGSVPNQTTGSNQFYVTWDLPKGGEKVTNTRLAWAVGKANGAALSKEAADKIQLALAGDPPIEPAYAYQAGHPLQGHQLPNCETASVWNLLDGTRFGECDEQARLMKAALNLLGIDAETALVFASTDSNVTNREVMSIDGSDAYLFMDFRGTEILTPFPDYPERWNQYEGVCKVAFDAQSEGVYAVWPSEFSTSMLGMLQLLGAPPGGIKQYWIYLTDVPEMNLQTTALSSGWQFFKMANLNPVPIPGG